MNKRQQQILDLLDKKKYVSISFLVNELHYSESTIRRDLKKMNSLGMIKRTPGGAMIVKDKFTENPDDLKFKINSEEKKLISELAIDFVEDFNTIFLDSSSTCQYLSEQLDRRKGLTIATTNLSTALMIDVKDNNNKLISIGGNVNDGKVGGFITNLVLSTISVNIAFLSCRGITVDYGSSDILDTEASIKQKIAEQADKVILLADSSKINKRFMYKSLKLDNIDVFITDKKPPNDFCEVLSSYDIEIVYWNDWKQSL